MDNKDKKIINFKDLSKNKKEDSSNNKDKKVINLEDFSKNEEKDTSSDNENLETEEQNNEGLTESNKEDSSKKINILFRVVNYISTFFDNTPPAIKSSILRSLSFALILDAMCVIMSTCTGFSLIMLLFCVGFNIFTLLCVISLHNRVKNDAYVTFIGVVIDCKKVGFGKKLGYYIVKIASPDGKILNFKYQQDTKGLDKGLPITLYIADTEPIIKTENGPYIERYLSIEYSADSVTDSENSNEDISISEYLNK